MFKRNNLLKLFVTMLLLVFLCSFTTTKAKVIYVDDDATGLNDGSSWDNAFIHLQDALGNASSSQGMVEIRVAQGIYIPYPDANTPDTKSATFQLINDVNIVGGFAGIGTINPDERNFETFKTILSGDLNGDDIEVNDPNDLLEEISRAENCYHVITANGTNETAILNGFIITGGNASEPENSWRNKDNYGGGIYNLEGNPFLINCTFIKNNAARGGGGIYNKKGKPNLLNCKFINNFSNDWGGAISNDGGDPNILYCNFRNNLAYDSGGAISNYQGNFTLISSSFTENHAASNITSSHKGGGIFNYEGNSIVIGCTFTRNTASYGGGISTYYSNMIIKDCTFIENSTFSVRTSMDSGAIYYTDGGGIYNNGSDTEIKNCIFRENLGSGIYTSNESSPKISNCTFIKNSSYEGGGIYNDESNSVLTNCLFIGNSAVKGGFMYTINSNPVITNSTIIGNTAEFGEAIICDFFNFSENNLIELKNCIIRQSENSISIEDDSTVKISYSNIFGGWPGEGNIDIDPMFIDPLGPDQIGGTEDDDLRLSPSSPCIDSGDPEYISLFSEKDIDGNPRVVSGRIDMGAYEFQNIIYVDDDAQGANDGSSWENAFCYLQDALNSVNPGYQIHVAQGTYTPDLGFSLDEDINDIRESTFTLKNDTTLLGGYAGLNTDNPDAREYDLYQTILSGDLNGDDVDVNIPNEPITNPNEIIDIPSKYDNCYHVVTSDEINENSVLNGFIIKGGYGNGIDNSNRRGAGLNNINGNHKIINCSFINNIAQNAGGGIYNEMSTLSITNCTFIRNYVLHEGGALYNNKGSLTLTNCNLENNSTVDEHFSYGGAIHNQESSLYLRNCNIKNNYAFIGGGIYNTTPSISTNWDSNSAFTPDWVFDINDIDNSIQIDFIIENCIFINNNAPYSGGAIYNYFGHISNIPDTAKYEFDIKTSSIIANCSFINNNGGEGGGLYLDYNKTFITNCLFSNNTAESGGGIYSRSDELLIMNCTSAWDYSSHSDGDFLVAIGADILNSIIWYCENPLEYDKLYQSSIDVYLSNIQGGWAGSGNIDEDPLFVDPLGPDMIGGTGDEDLSLSPMSPCVNTGQITTDALYAEYDLDGNPRIFDEYIDMGAFEFQGEIYVDDDPYLPDPNSVLDGSRTRPFNNIQEAIDIAKDNFTINVLPGEYDKINFMGKAITVTGFGGAATIQASGDAVTFHSGEDANSVLKNFILCNSELGISLNYGSSPTIHNVTIANNLFGIAAYEDSNPDIRNCIFYNNVDGDLFGCESWYSCIESGDPNKHNFYADPLFVDAINGDYHLKSEGWRWSENSESWTWDEITSFCIDAGDPYMSLADEPMSISRDPNNSYGKNRRINVGAYGGTLQASMPPLGWVPININDFTPPSPNPAQWAYQGEPHEVIQDSSALYKVEMEAQTATDASGYVEYYFECTTNNKYSSIWQPNPKFSILFAGYTGPKLSFRYKARDLYSNETEWSEIKTAD